MNVQYKQQGDYLIPCVRTKKQREIHIGVWANRHKQYLKQSHKVRYYNLLTSEKLYDYLADIEERTENMFSRPVNELSEKENVTEALKADNAMEWVRKMNNIRSRAKLGIDLFDKSHPPSILPALNQTKPPESTPKHNSSERYGRFFVRLIIKDFRVFLSLNLRQYNYHR